MHFVLRRIESYSTVGWASDIKQAAVEIVLTRQYDWMIGHMCGLGETYRGSRILYVIGVSCRLVASLRV